MTQKPSQEARDESICVGEHIAGQVSLTRTEIADFARLCGDLNPLHHNESYAQQTRFVGVIACGPHITSLMMGLTATYFSQNTAMLGLEFSFRFLKAVKAGDTVTMDWEIISTEPKATLGGQIVTLEGMVTNQDGQRVLTGSGKVLVVDKL